MSVKENAKKNGVSEAGIRYYIKANSLDRRFDRKQIIIADCQKYLKKHPKATKVELQQKTGHSLSTIRQYWEYITTNRELTDFNKEKAKIRQESKFDVFKNIPEALIREYLAEIDKGNIQPNTQDNQQSKDNLEVKILDDIKFKPFEEYQIPIKECIQFHSKALPENKVLSNHYDCIITFRGVEFYSLEQLFMGLTYSDSPKILKGVMAAKNGIAAKKLCRENYADDRDYDFEKKRYRIIALCHLYKYLSVKEYRDRLRETYPQTLVECPNGRDYHFGMAQNLDTNLFEGNNCSGRTTMIVRDKMIELERKAVSDKEAEIGRKLTLKETEQEYEKVYQAVRSKYDNDKQVIADSRKLFAFIEKEGIPKIKKRRPVPRLQPIIDRNSLCLVLDFDNTIFDTSADDKYRKCEGKKDMEKAFSLIPEYRLYEGWREVFEWAKQNRVKIGILSGASGKLIQTALEHFKIPYDAIVGYQPYMEKPNPILGNMIMEKLNVREEQILFVGDGIIDDIQARCSKFKFVGAVWDSPYKEEFTRRGIPTIDNPRNIISLLGGNKSFSLIEMEKQEAPSISSVSKSKLFTSPNGQYDIVVCHNALDAQMYVNESGYNYPAWCYVTSQGSFDKYTSHTQPLGEKGGVLVIFFRKDSNTAKKSKGGSISKPLLCDDYAISVFSLTTDYRKEDGKVFVRSVTNRYNLTKDIYAASKPSDAEAAEVRKGLNAISEATGMDVEQFSIDNTPKVRDRREDYGMDMFEEKFNDGRVALFYPKLNIPKDKKTVLCTIKDSYGDDVVYDIQPSGAVHPHGCPHDTMNFIIDELPNEAIKILRELYPRYICKLAK